MHSRNGQIMRICMWFPLRCIPGRIISERSGKRHNRYGKHSSVSSYTNGFNGSKDISWDVAVKMYQKINQEENYAPIFMDSGVYIPSQGCLGEGKSVTFHILDWNMNPTIYTYTDTGYNNNMYKLAVMLFSMDSELFQRLYLDGEDALIQKERN